MKSTLEKETPAAKATTKKKTARLPDKIDQLVEALTKGILAAVHAPAGTVNVADYLSPPQMRLLARLAAKAGETPRQFLNGIVRRLARPPRLRAAHAGGAA